MKNKFLKIGLILSTIVLTVLSCEDSDDYTGQSSLEASAPPSLSVTLGFNENQTLVEKDTVYPFTVSISEPPQIVNISVNLAQVGGTATKGDDFDFPPEHVVIPKGSTSATGEISILSDSDIEVTETASIKIATGSEANVSGISSKTVTFNIMNVTEGALDIELSWTTTGTVTDNSGNEIEATDLADLILQVQDASGEVIHEADGASFEHVVISPEDPDGEYFVVAKFFDAMDISADINLMTAFDQAGIINHDTFEFPSAMNTSFVCDNNFYTLNKIIKTGESYTIESIGEASTYPQNIAGTYNVISNGESTDDGPENNPLVAFMSTVEITDNGDGPICYPTVGRVYTLNGTQYMVIQKKNHKHLV